MPPWPGGPCPVCGEDMPERLIHCRNCRAMLNSDFESDSIEIPAFVPLKEIAAHVTLPIRGYYIPCPSCQRELRINKQFVGRKVTCKHCQAGFRFRVDDPAVSSKLALYVYCPHCNERLRMSQKYLDVRIACKACKGELIVSESDSVPDARLESPRS